MKASLVIGVILIILGIAALAYHGVPYTQQHKAELGPLKLTASEEKTFPIPPIVSIAAIAGGVVLVVAGARKT